jgi:hypothetical protein
MQRPHCKPSPAAIELAASACGGHTADTVYGGHEKVLRRAFIAVTAHAVLAEHENPGRQSCRCCTGGSACPLLPTGDIDVLEQRVRGPMRAWPRRRTTRGWRRTVIWWWRARISASSSQSVMGSSRNIASALVTPRWASRSSTTPHRHQCSSAMPHAARHASPTGSRCSA